MRSTSGEQLLPIGFYIEHTSQGLPLASKLWLRPMGSPQLHRSGGQCDKKTQMGRQKGPSFPHPVEVSIDVSKGEVVIRSMEDGKGG